MRPGSNKGQDNFKNKLTNEDVIFIYTNKNVSQGELARKFQISQSTISQIRNSKTWVWLTSTLKDNEDGHSNEAGSSRKISNGARRGHHERGAHR
jgi:hypothetical protein